MNESSATLPSLRDDLQLYPHGTDARGCDVAMIYDPLRHAYFRLGGDALKLVLNWRGSATVAEAKIRVDQKFGDNAHEASIRNVASFLVNSQLTINKTPGLALLIAQRAAAQRQGTAQRILHNYLFFRIPLVRPAKILAEIGPFFGFIFNTAFLYLVISLFITGMYLVSREWDSFVSGVQQQAQWSGLLMIALVLTILKTVHEFGHAITATRYGCKVSTMGVALMLLAPVLYTDTTDAWRVRSKKQRLLITSAGVIAELICAAVALFAWAFLNDGMLRQIAITIAIVAPVTTLAINLNPCMRFDGYFILSDLLGVENLQARSFAMARWRLREILFAPGELPPESFNETMRKVLIVYAWTVWIYRLFIFVGIALFVYAFFVKLAGIVLFVIEMLWFVILPVVREIQEWFKRKEKIVRTRRSMISAAAFVVLIAGIFVPWSTSVHIPAVIVSEQEHLVHALASGRIVELGAVRTGQQVNAGDLILRLESPDLNLDIRKAETEIALLRYRIARLAGDPKDQEIAPVLHSDLASKIDKLAGLRRVEEDLTVRSPAQGFLADVDPDIHAGRWIKPSLHLATIVGGEVQMIRALAGEQEITRLAIGNNARFVPSDAARASVDAKVISMDRVNETFISVESLAMPYGGSIQVSREQSGKLRPVAPVFPVRLSTSAVQQPANKDNQVLRGVAVIDGKAESFATQIWRRIARVAIRESGF